MKKTVISVLVVAAATLTSCEKMAVDSSTSIDQQATEEEATVQVRTSNYERREVGTLVHNGEHTPYESGKIEYLVDGQVHAVVSFDDDKVEIYQDGELTGERDLDRDSRRCGCDGDHKKPDYKGKKGKKPMFGKKPHKGGKKCGGDFEKVIIEPIVKSDDCEYPIAGTIDFLKEGTWVATIDFGNGTCDDEATKTTADGVYTFSMSEWFNK